MCDYSLCGLPNRLAIEGEELVTYRFKTGTKGMASVPELEAIANPPAPVGPWARIVAWWRREIAADRNPLVVCLPPGATLSLLHDSSVPTAKGLIDCYSHPLVRFTQRSAAENSYRDALEFDNGSGIRVSELISDLPAGLRMRVLSLEPRLTDDHSVRHFYEEESVRS
jgi:hypothetical protein